MSTSESNDHAREQVIVSVVLALLMLLTAAPLGAQAPTSKTVWLPLVMKVNTNPLHQGIATYYYATGAGACSFDPSPSDLMVAAMNGEEYDNAALCGAYVFVTGPKGSATVRIVDRCPECKAGHLDLSQEAFSKIADLLQGAFRSPGKWSAHL